MAAASQDVATRTPEMALVNRIRSDEFQQEVALALPETVSPAKFTRGAVTALLTNPDLAKLEPTSLFRALIQCAHDGLLPDGQEAAIVPHKGKATYMPMVGGFRKIAADHGWTLRAQAVYEHDEFDYSEEPPRLMHRPVRPGEERGPLIAAYAIATDSHGRRMQCVLHPDEIAKRREMAQTKAVWDKWTPQMWAKSAARDLFADLPLGNLDERVLRVLNASRVDPQESSALLYGRRSELTPGEPAPADVDGRSASSAVDGRQAGDAAKESSPPASPAPDSDDDEPGPSEAGDAEALAKAAGEVTVPKGTRHHSGESIAAIHALGEDGEKWLAWALEDKRAWNKADSKDGIFGEALRVYVAFYLPELWAAQAGSAA